MMLLYYTPHTALKLQVLASNYSSTVDPLCPSQLLHDKQSYLSLLAQRYDCYYTQMASILEATELK